MKTRMCLTLVFCIAIAAFTLRPVSAIEKRLEIGSPAPPLNIEHWIQDGNGFFKPVTEFHQGKVYVVEFWATWCGPCIASMPHLAELQNKYRGRGVQIVSVSDETVDEVRDLLGQQNPQLGKTFSEITSAYSLTTDPDGSVHRDYMEASGQQGIPTAFLVGKSGQIEWIGHPHDLEEPLEAVVTDSWDREAFKQEMLSQQHFQTMVQKLSRLAGAGKFEEALKLAEQELAKTKSEKIREEWSSIRYSLKLSTGQLDSDVLGYFRKKFAELKGDPTGITGYGYSMYNLIQQGAKVGPLAGELAGAIEAELDDATDEMKPVMYNTIALLCEVDGNLDAAIKAQQAAIDAANDRQKTRLKPFLEELKAKAAGETK
ncbi:MAG: TlpA family protein disulfide reductase [Pirellulales bacterium]|nr:TlpA family protein disulfide reductase [Pirellulales bacterium]